MSESDTSAIDDKSGSTDSDNEKLKKFGKQIGYVLLPLVYSILSGFVLFSCKIGQSDMLPKSNCFPFTTNSGKFQPSDDAEGTKVTLDIFTSGGMLTPTLSEKFHLDYAENKNYQLFDKLLAYKKDVNSSAVGNYAASVIIDNLLFHMTALGLYFSFLNQMPEIAIIIVGPLITFFVVFLVMMIIGFFNSMYAWVSNMSWFFKERIDGKWQYTSWASFTPWLLLIVFGILFFFGMFSGLFVLMSFFSVCAALMTILYFNATITEVKIIRDKEGKEINKEENKVPITPLKTFMKVSMLYKSAVAGLMCLILLIIMANIFEPIILIGPIIIMGLVGSGKVTSIFRETNDSNLSKLTKLGTKQVKRICTTSMMGGALDGMGKMVEMTNNYKKYFGGKRLVQEIKRVGTKLKKNK